MKLFDDFFDFRHLIPLTHSALWFLGLWIGFGGYRFFVTDNADIFTGKMYALAFSFIIFLSEVALSFFDIGFSDGKKGFNSKVFLHFGIVSVALAGSVVFGMLYIKYRQSLLIVLVFLSLCVIKFISSYMTRNKELYLDKERGFSYKTNEVGENQLRI